MKAPLIDIDRISKQYSEGTRERIILHEMSLTVDRGEIIVMLGRSGSGKSTLLNLISGIDRPTGGSIRIAGKRLTHLSERERTLFRRENIGFVFQFFNLVPTLTVEENLLLPLELNRKIDGQSDEKVAELLREIGLTGREKSFPDQLSGGEQQRVAIARALIHTPPIILADEPTGNLDYNTGTMVINLLDRMVRLRGATMIMATHSREVIGMADRLVSVRSGKLVELTGKELDWVK